VARRDGASVRLLTRAGNDFSRRFPFIAMAVAALLAESCVIDGEAMVTNEHGLAVFDLIRGHGAKAEAVHCAFDLLELDGEDLRREPIEGHACKPPRWCAFRHRAQPAFRGRR
jgi:bifunctional non-homologous end joining protein LigD